MPILLDGSDGPGYHCLAMPHLTHTLPARLDTSLSAEILALAAKTHFYARVGSAMSECAYGAVGHDRDASPSEDDVAYAEEALGREMSSTERGWFAEGFAAEHAHWSSDIEDDERDRRGL